MPILDPVELYSNGEYINEEVLNRPLNQMNTNINKINYRVDTLLQDDIVSETEGWSSSKIKFEFDNFSPNVFNDNIISPYFGWSSQKIASLFSGGSGTPTLLDPFDDNIVSTEYGWTSSKIRLEIDKCCAGGGSGGTGSGIRTPSAIYPLSGDSNVPQGVELQATPYYHFTAVSRKHRVFQIDYSDGTFINPLYEVSENSDSHVITYTLETDKVYKWRCKDVDVEDGESGWSTPQVFSTNTDILIPAPILKRDAFTELPSTMNETEILSVLISNYDQQYTYNVELTGGVKTGGPSEYSWQMPEVTEDTEVTISAQATDGDGNFSSTTTHTLTVLNVEMAVSADDFIQVTDYPPAGSFDCQSYGFIYI